MSDAGAIDSRGANPSIEQMVRHLRRANAIAGRAVVMGHHPFGAILVGPDHETILLEQGNVGTVNHAEAVLARAADMNFTSAYLWDCSLYTTVEPCAMCSATQYWANIGRLVYGLGERRLLELTGNHAENPTMDVPARYIFEHSQKAIRVTGPIPQVEEEIAELHRNFWQRA